MEEEIVYLEEVIALAKMFLGTSSSATIQEKEIEAIENLLKAYKELEEKNERLIIEKATALQEVRKYKEMVKGYKDRVEELKQELKKFYEGEIFTAKQLKNIEQNQKKHFINKQTVKEKIEELKQEIEQIRNETGVTWDNEMYVNQTKIDVLQELLEEE